MADTPKRPIMLRFVLGKGAVKRRQETENTTRVVVEQAAIQYARDTWDASKQQLQQRIAEDVRMELVHVARDFRRNLIGAPSNQRGLVGTLKSVSKGDGQPSQSLGSLPRWAPRGAKYLERKFESLGHKDWFDNTGWNDQKKWPSNPGTLKEFFDGTEVVDGANIGGGGVFEDMFGGITVQVLRNNRGWGVASGTIKIGSQGKTAQIQLGTIRVRALGKLTDSALHHTNDSPNRGLLDLIGAENPAVALHLRGGRGRYRPTLEPYLRFFVERAMPHAVSERIRKGSIIGHIIRTS